MGNENRVSLVAHAVWLLATSSIAVAQTQWSQVRVAPRAAAPLPIWGSLACDEIRREIVQFGGGSTANPFPKDTWGWDGIRWTKKLSPNSPPGRVGHAMAFDGSRVILFGGMTATSGGNPIDETWAWDGTTWTKLQLATRPTARFVSAMVYDRARGRVILFGGARGVTFLFDTWEWDGSRWRRLGPPVSPAVSGRMTYDEHRQRSVLVGGPLGSGPIEVWEWDGTAWTNRPASATPPQRGAPAIAYDVRSRRIVLFGGSDSSGDRRDTWEWDGTTWTERPTVEPPSARAFHAMVHDPQRGELVLFGGFSSLSSGQLDDTWTLDAKGWHYRGPETSPPPRTGHALAFDASRNRAVVVGGSLASGQQIGATVQTWEFNGSVWKPRFPLHAPQNRVAHAVVDDAVRDRIVLFGGYGTRPLGDTWEWDGTDWVERTAASSPPARSGHAMAFDEARGRVLLFGGLGANGVPLADTWRWDGATWTALPSTAPPARSFHGLAHDSLRGRTVLYGGTSIDPTGAGGVLADTWEFDGTQWRQMHPATSPPARSTHVLVYDRSRARTVLSGGWDGRAALGDTWEWDGRDWQRSASAPARFASAATYDTTNQRVLAFGGADRNGKLDDTWKYVPGVRHRVLGYGAGCLGSNGIPQLDAVGAPILGNRDFALRLHSGRPLAAALVVLAAANANVVLPGGCTLLVQSPWIALPTSLDAAGMATLALSVPANVSLRGLSAFAQGIVADPRGAFGGWAFTAGLRLVIGD